MERRFYDKECSINQQEAKIALGIRTVPKWLSGKTWRAKVSWYDLTGKRRFKTKQGFSTKSQARKWANEMEVAKDDLK